MVKSIEKELRQAKKHLAAEEREFGEQVGDTIDIAESEDSIQELLERQATTQSRIEDLKEQRRQLPKRVSPSNEKTLKREQHLVRDAIKMSAYQVEGALMNMLRDVYARNDDEGRTLLQSAFQSRGSIAPLLH